MSKMISVIVSFIFLWLLLPVSLLATTSSIKADFNGTPISAGNTLWFSSSLQLTGALPSAPVNIYLVDGSISFKVNSTTYTIAVPNAQVFFNPSAATSSTSFSNGQWLTSTTGPNTNLTFLQGVAFAAPAGGLPGGIKNVTWSGNFTTDTSNINLNWKWAAAVYTNNANFTDLASIGVWPTNSSGFQPGTPTNEISFITGGARGGGGSNYTGSFSGSESVSPSFVALPEPSVYLLLGSFLGIFYLMAGRKKVAAAVQK